MITDDQKRTYIGLYLMKKIDLGTEIPVVLPSDLAPIDDYLQELAVDGYFEIDAKRGLWKPTAAGLDYLRSVIDEAADLVDEFDEAELPDALDEMRVRKLDLVRARFLWGWFEGEFDDLALFQERRGAKNVERLWAFYLTSDEFWSELVREVTPQLLSA